MSSKNKFDQLLTVRGCYDRMAERLLQMFGKQRKNEVVFQRMDELTGDLTVGTIRAKREKHADGGFL